SDERANDVLTDEARPAGHEDSLHDDWIVAQRFPWGRRALPRYDRAMRWWLLLLQFLVLLDTGSLFAQPAISPPADASKPPSSAGRPAARGRRGRCGGPSSPRAGGSACCPGGRWPRGPSPGRPSR